MNVCHRSPKVLAIQQFTKNDHEISVWARVEMKAHSSKARAAKREQEHWEPKAGKREWDANAAADEGLGYHQSKKLTQAKDVQG
jgi:hypothetical protein